MKVHITNPRGFLGRYLSAESVIRGHRLVDRPEDSDVLILSGWWYRNHEKSLANIREDVSKFRGAAIVGIGSQAELWWPDAGQWTDYGKAKIEARGMVLGSSSPVKNWVRLSTIVGRGVTRGALLLDALASRRTERPMILRSDGSELMSVCDVRLVAQNILDIPERGSHIRNGWGERAPVTAYLDSWGVQYELGAEKHPSTPPAFDERDWNGWLDVGFTPEEFEKLLHNYDQMEIV